MWWRGFLMSLALHCTVAAAVRALSPGSPSAKAPTAPAACNDDARNTQSTITLTLVFRWPDSGLVN